jgi:hypothetical protein
MKLSDLLDAEDRLVAPLELLPFQEGRPLATVAEESTELVDASSDAVSEDEATANAGDENDADREARRTGTELAQPAEGGSMSACDPCIVSLTPNSLP